MNSSATHKTANPPKEKKQKGKRKPLIRPQGRGKTLYNGEDENEIFPNPDEDKGHGR